MIILDYRKEGARDPDVVYHEGRYYCLYAYQDKLWIKSAPSIEGLKEAEGKVVYELTETGDFCIRPWAPELHFINNEWHIYTCFGDKNSTNQHMYVLRNHSTDPSAPYVFASYLDNGDDGWAIDGSIFYHEGNMYYVWSSFGTYFGEVYQALYIAKMKNPYTLELPRKLLSLSEYDWEKGGCDGGNRPYVNEGPFALYHNGKLLIVYSASGCWTDHYCLGLLTYKGGDILDKANWEKLPHPILSNADGYDAPGHASFIQNAPDGKTYCFFHAYETDCQRGEPYVLGHAATVAWDGDVPFIKEDI